jgi:hypothetical protein
MDKEICIAVCVLDRCVTGGMNSKLPAQHELVSYNVPFMYEREGSSAD